MRTYPMTEKAVQATWSNTTGTPHIPVRWGIIGDSTTGYTVMTLDKDFCGFSIYDTPTLKSAKGFIREVNETGDSRMKAFCSLGAFAWKSHKMPI